MLRPVFIFLILAILAIVWKDTIIQQEPFEPSSESVSTMILDTLKHHGVNFGPGGLSQVSMIDRSVQAPVQTNMLGIVFGGAPAFRTKATARLAFLTRGGDTIKTPAYGIEGRGETRDSSVSDANTGLESVMRDVEQKVRARGYMT